VFIIKFRPEARINGIPSSTSIYELSGFLFLLC
jgi:hypothetical protein